MEAIFVLSPSNFYQALSHISLYHEPLDHGWDTFVKDVMTKSKMNPDKFNLWKVNGLQPFLGKSVPVDVHGNTFLIDSEYIAEKDPHMTHGVLKYMTRVSAARRKEGGRWVYDYAMLNFTLLCGTMIGSAVLYKGRRDWNWMTKRPISAVLGCSLFMAAVTPFVKQGFNLFGLGMWLAEKSHKRSINWLGCSDCLLDLNEHSEKQLHDLREKILNPKKDMAQAPGMPEPPPEYLAQLVKQAKNQSLILERETLEMKAIIRRSGGILCDVHQGLRHDPENYKHPKDYPIFPQDRTNAKIRNNLLGEAVPQDAEHPPKKFDPPSAL